MLFAYMAGREGVGVRGFKMFCQRGSEFFLLALCVCGGGDRFSTSNKKSEGSLRRLSFYKILLVNYIRHC